MAIAANTLLEESKCYTCLGVSQIDALILALENRIAEEDAAPPGPPITFNTLQMLVSGADANNYSTPSQTPTANALVLALVINSKATIPETPVAAGNGLTWVEVLTSTAWNGNTARLTVFRAMGAAPTPGAFSVTFGGVTQTGCLIKCMEFLNVDTTGTNGSGAIAQALQTGGATADPSINLAAFNPNGRNAGVVLSGNLRNPYGATAELGWTEDFDSGALVPTRGIYTAYRLATTDNTIVLTSLATTWHLVGIEVKAGP